MPTHRLQSQHTALLVIDIQVKLLPHIHNAAQVASRSGVLIDGFKALGLPILVTEQYRKGLGATVPELSERLARAAGATIKGDGGTSGGRFRGVFPGVLRGVFPGAGALPGACGDF